MSRELKLTGLMDDQRITLEGLRIFIEAKDIANEFGIQDKSARKTILFDPDYEQIGMIVASTGTCTLGAEDGSISVPERTVKVLNKMEIPFSDLS